jgi:hypothetical protein
VADAFSGHTVLRDPVQFLVHKRNQPFERGVVALAPGEQQSGDLWRVLVNGVILAPFWPVQLSPVFSRYRAREQQHMTSRVSGLVILLAIAPGLTACVSSHGGPSAPTSGSVASAAVTPVGTGHVLDTAFTPLAGVRVDVVSGPQAGASMITDGNGTFPLTGTFERADMFRASSDGYVTATQGFATSSPGGTSWIIFYLPPVAPPVNLAGDYVLTIVADSTCTDVPSALRTRSYPASIVQGSGPTNFVLTATGGVFLDNLRGFGIGVAGNSLGLWLHGGHDPTLVEQLAPDTYLAVSGFASTLAGPSAGSTISAALDGWIDYCVAKGPMGPGYNCGTSNATGEPIAGAAVTYAHCQSANHRLILVRR